MYTVVTETSGAPIVETFLFRQNAEAMYIIRCQTFEMVSLFDPNGNLINISYVEDWEVMKMYISRSKYLVEKLIARQRIEYLERIICPNGHDYKYIDCFKKYVCTHCGKIREEITKWKSI